MSKDKLNKQAQTLLNAFNKLGLGTATTILFVDHLNNPIHTVPGNHQAQVQVKNQVKKKTKNNKPGKAHFDIVYLHDEGYFDIYINREHYITHHKNDDLAVTLFDVDTVAYFEKQTGTTKDKFTYTYYPLNDYMYKKSNHMYDSNDYIENLAKVEAENMPLKYKDVSMRKIKEAIR